MPEHIQTGGASADPFAPLPRHNGHAHDALAKAPKNEELWDPTPTPLDLAVPVTADLYHPGFGAAVAVWPWLNAAGELLFVTARFERRDGDKVKKDVTPFCHGRRIWTDTKGVKRDITGWHMKAPPAPRPLMGLQGLAARPKAPVILVEGEKKVAAAERLFPDFVAVTSQGGSKAAKNTDWTPLSGREVVAWPDQDEPGRHYALAVAGLARPGRGLGPKAKSFRIVEVPRDWPEGWDLADPLPPGASPELLAELLAEAQDADPPQLPPNFTFRDSGLWFEEGGDMDDDAPAERVFISAPFEVVGEANDGTGNNWGLVLRWKDRDDRQHQWSVPKRLIHADGSRIAEELENAGLHCNPSGKAHKLLQQFIGGVRTKRRRICVDQTGWHMANGRHVFIMPGGEAYGPAASTVILQTEHAGSDSAFLGAGTLAEWQEHVGALAIGNSRLAFAISVALTAPLIDVIGGENGGFHFVGEGRKGKSTIAYAAGSVWGKGARGAQIRNWKATSNGLEGAASDTSDTVLILDEIGQALSHEVADVVYMLANGSGKQRADKGGSARRTRTWRTQFISTGEMTLAQKIAEAGKRMMGGLEARLVNVPAEPAGGMGVFQKLHRTNGAADFAKLIERMSATHYGTAGRAFVSALVRERVTNTKRLADRVRAAQAGFVKKHVPEGASTMVGNIAERFALVGVAGELAVEWGVLPWARGEAMAAATACFKDWLGARGTTASPDDIAALRQVQAFLIAHGESRFAPLYQDQDPLRRQVIHNRVGWRHHDTRHGLLYLVPKNEWEDVVCAGQDPRRVIRVLSAQGVLRRDDKDGRPAAAVHVPDLGTTARLYRVSADIFGLRGEPGEDESLAV